MTTMIFDTHAFVKELTQAGMPEEQAEVLAQSQAAIKSWQTDAVIRVEEV